MTKCALVGMATAMGLHRDPGRMPVDIAERRRSAWWHILTFDRQALKSVDA
jgi:hypothetical protein